MRNDKGIVLVLSLLVMVVLSVMALAFLSIAMLEHNIANNYMKHTKAFYVADGGVDVGRQRLKVTADWTILDGQTFDCSLPASPCQFTVSNVSPDGDYAEVTASASHFTAKASVAVGVTKYQMPVPPGGITSLGPGTVAFNGNAFEIDGNNWVPPADDGSSFEVQDNSACGPIPVPKYGIAVKDAATQLDVHNGLTSQQQDNVMGATSDPPLGSPASIGVDATLTEAQILEIADVLMTESDIDYAPGTALASETLGTHANPKIVTVDATGFAGGPALELNASSGAGVLIVKNGTLRLAGNTQWTGLVLLVGENASLDMAGGGDKSIYGSVVIVETLNPTTTIATGGGNLKARFSCDGLAVAEYAMSGLNAKPLWWKEVR